MTDGSDAVTWLRPNQVAATWGCNRKTVAIWAAQYDVTTKRLPGGENRYRSDDVERVRRTLEP